MLRKYVGETAILFPADIPRRLKDAYTYTWKYKHVIFSTSYHASFVFTHPGIHRFELIVVDKKIGTRYTFVYLVEAMQSKFIFQNTSVDYFGLVSIWRGADVAGSSYQAGHLRIYAPLSATTGSTYLNIGGILNDVEQILCYRWLQGDNNGFWSTGSLNYSRSLNGQAFGCVCPTLLDGKVLVAGNTSEADYGDTTEIYDLTTETWTLSGSMNTPRHKFCFPVLMADGKVFVFGGCDIVNVFNVDYEIFDPATGTWTSHSPAPGSYLLTGDYGYVAPPILLNDGRILILHSHENCLSIFNPSNSSFTKITCTTTISRAGCSILQAPSHEIYFVAGLDTNSICKYNITTNTWTILPSWVDPEFSYKATLTGNCWFIRKNALLVVSSVQDHIYVEEYDYWYYHNFVYALSFNIDRNTWDYVGGRETYTSDPEVIHSNAFETGHGGVGNRFNVWGGSVDSNDSGFQVYMVTPYFHAPIDMQLPYVSSIILPYSFYRDSIFAKYDFTTSLLNGSEVTMTLDPNPDYELIYETTDDPEYYNSLGKIILENYVNVSLTFYGGGGGGT